MPQNLNYAIVEANINRKDFTADVIICKKPTVFSIYRLIMKIGSNNLRVSRIQGIMKRIKSKAVERSLSRI